MKVVGLAFASVLVATARAGSIHVRVHAAEPSSDDGFSYAMLDDQCAFDDGSELPCEDGLVCMIGEDENGYCMHYAGEDRVLARKHVATKEEGEGAAVFGEQCAFPDGGALPCAEDLECYVDDEGFGVCDFPLFDKRSHKHKKEGIFGDVCLSPDGLDEPCAEDFECYVDDEGFGVCDYPLFDKRSHKHSKGVVESNVKLGGQCFKNGGALLCEPGTSCLIDQQKNLGWCVPGKSDGGVCYKQCGNGEYCAKGSDKCFKPKESICMNPATGLFQIGCDNGFKCSNGKCVYAKKTHHHRRHVKEEGNVGDACAFPDGTELPCAEHLECFYDDKGFGVCDRSLFGKRSHKHHKGVVKSNVKLVAGRGGQCFFPDGRALPCAGTLECYIDDKGFGVCDDPLFDKRSHKHKKGYVESNVKLGGQCFKDGGMLLCEPGTSCLIDQQKNLGWCVPGKSDGGICYKQCGDGEYCAKGSDKCFKPKETICMNPATGLFQIGCDKGFKCSNGKCVYAKKHHHRGHHHHKSSMPRASVDEQCQFEDGRKAQCEDNHMCIVDKATNTGYCVPGNPNGAICYRECKQEGTYCAKGSDTCYEAWGATCLNPATGLFQAGCDAGFKCENFKCVYA